MRNGLSFSFNVVFYLFQIYAAVSRNLKKIIQKKILYDKIVSEKYVNSVFSKHPKTKMTVRKFKVDESSRQTLDKLQQNFKISITK